MELLNKPINTKMFVFIFRNNRADSLGWHIAVIIIIKPAFIECLIHARHIFMDSSMHLPSAQPMRKVPLSSQ